MILSSDKSSERNLSCFFDIKKPIEHLQSEEPFSSDPYFRCPCNIIVQKYLENHKDRLCVVRIFIDQTLHLNKYQSKNYILQPFLVFF